MWRKLMAVIEQIHDDFCRQFRKIAILVLQLQIFRLPEQPILKSCLNKLKMITNY